MGKTYKDNRDKWRHKFGNNRDKKPRQQFDFQKERTQRFQYEVMPEQFQTQN